MAAKWPHLWRLTLPNGPIQHVQRWAKLAPIRAATALSASGAHAATPAANHQQNVV